MLNFASVIGIVFVTVCLPLIVVMHYVTKWRQTREISGDDEKMLEEMWQLAQRIEERIDTLEKILDHDEKDWRTKE